MDFAEKATGPNNVPPGVPEFLNKLPIPVQNGTVVEQQQNVTPAQPVSRLTIWTHRLSLVVFVVFCVELGMFLAILPWLTVWNHNVLLTPYPVARQILQHNFMRGVVSGLGLIDIWIGIWEAVHYHDPGKA